MKFLDLTLPTMAENLALDEALLEEADRADQVTEVLRLWESPDFAVVVGRSSKVDVEVEQSACQADGVPIFRRCSGGTSVVAGPGCLMYALVISYQEMPELRVVDEAHRYVMDSMSKGLSELNPQVTFRGSCDLTIDDRKFSGNALRCKRNCFLYHGTVLYDFSLERISKYLATPPRQPDYRDGRSHGAFVRNFPATPSDLRRVIRNAWGATETQDSWPVVHTAALAKQRYSDQQWNLQR